MATVRFSKELVNDITRSANGKMEFAVTRARETRPDNQWGQRIYDIMFCEDKPFIAQVPAGWLPTTETLTISKIGTTRFDIQFKFAPPVPWPAKFYESDFAKREYSYRDDIVLKEHPVWDEFNAEMVAYNLRVTTAVQRQADYVGMVSKICSAYSTLAPALKAWPPLWDLIPENVKNKHREIKERTKNEVVLDIDINKLTAMSTAAKFGI